MTLHCTQCGSAFPDGGIAQDDAGRYWHAQCLAYARGQAKGTRSEAISGGLVMALVGFAVGTLGWVVAFSPGPSAILAGLVGASAAGTVTYVRTMTQPD